MDEIKTKTRPSWGIYLLLSVLVASVVYIVFGTMSVKQINEELYISEYVDRQQNIPFFKWFNGLNEVENPRLNESIAELNNHTLREVFEGGNVFPELTGNVYNSNNNNSRIGVRSNGNIGALYGNSNHLFNIISSHSYYFYIKANESYPYPRNQLRFSLVDDTVFLEQNYIGDVYLVSDVLSFNQNYSDVYLHQVSLAQEYKWDYMGSIDLISFQISNLTKEQMDYWFNVYEYEKQYSFVPLYDVSAYGVTPKQLEYYYNQYLHYVETMNLKDVYLVYTNPEYNSEIGRTFVVQYENFTKSILDTIGSLKDVYNNFKKSLDNVSEFFENPLDKIGGIFKW